MIPSRSSGPPRILTFGILHCIQCGSETIFRAMAPCSHITDAACEDCGWTYGRRSERVLAGAGTSARYELRENIPVVSDELASEAAARLLQRTGQRGISPERLPPPLDLSRMPSQGSDTASRISRLAAPRQS